MTTTPGMSSDEPKTSQAVGDAYALFLVSLFLVVTVGAVAQLGAAAKLGAITAGLFVTEIFLILLPAVLYVRLKRLPLVQALRWRPVSPGIALRAAILGVSAWGMAIIIGVAAGKLIETALGAPPPLPERWLPTTGPGFGIFLLVGSALAGVCEETLFRGAIQGTLEKGGARKGIAVTALLFAIYHLNPWTFLPILAVGVFLGFITLRTNSTLPAMICHACINVVSLTALFVYRDEHESFLLLLAGVLAFLFLAALAEFVRRTRGSERWLSPLTEVPAGLSRRFTRIAGGVALAVILVVLVAFGVFLKGYHMTSDRLAPEIRRGDRILVLKTRYLHMDIQPGDVIAHRQGKYTFLRKVSRVDADRIWVIEDSGQAEPSEIPIAQRDVIGKVIHRVRIKR